MESLILAAGLILFSGTASYEMYNKSEVAKNNSKKSGTPKTAYLILSLYF